MPAASGESGTSTALAELLEPMRQSALDRHHKLRPYLEQNLPLARVAKEVSVPFRTAQRWVSRYRRFGLVDLVRTRQAARGQRRCLYEADRLKVPSLEQLHDLFDRSSIGLVLVGMPGIEKRLARYPQFYSRVGFVHAFRSLRAEEVRRLLAEHWPKMGFMLPDSGISDKAAVAAIIRITGGNFRLMRRLLEQVERLLEINQLKVVTIAAMEAVREGLVIGTA